MSLRLDTVLPILASASRIVLFLQREQLKLYVEIGEIMRNEREARKIPLRKLAKKMGISAPYLCDMELGRRSYSIEWCNKAIQILEGIK